MAINQNHLFEDLNGVKCAIVEKNVVAARVDFLRGILEYNGYTVVVVGSPPAKGGAAAAAGGGVAAAAGGTAASAGGTGAPVAGVGDKVGPAAGGEGVVGEGSAVAPAPAPETFTVGVTDVTFNPVNAIFGRLLKREGGHVVTLAYWQGKGEEGEERPYFEK